MQTWMRRNLPRNSRLQSAASDVHGRSELHRRAVTRVVGENRICRKPTDGVAGTREFLQRQVLMRRRQLTFLKRITSR